jgi:hypothetical protein
VVTDEFFGQDIASPINPERCLSATIFVINLTAIPTFVPATGNCDANTAITKTAHDAQGIEGRLRRLPAEVTLHTSRVLMPSEGKG